MQASQGWRSLQVERRPPTEGRRVNSAPHVLVIDGASDTGAVLKAVLEPKGANVVRTRGVVVRQRAEEMACPHVVVIDLDDESADATASCFGDSHRVLIGSV